MDAELILAAEGYFQTHAKKIKEFRNAFGGHLLDAGVEFATTHVSNVTGKVTWDSTLDGAVQALELHFASDIVTGAISSKLDGNADIREEVGKMSTIILGGYNHARGAMYALGRAFLWDKFGK